MDMRLEILLVVHVSSGLSCVVPGISEQAVLVSSQSKLKLFSIHPDAAFYLYSSAKEIPTTHVSSPDDSSLSYSPKVELRKDLLRE